MKITNYKIKDERRDGGEKAEREEERVEGKIETGQEEGDEIARRTEEMEMRRRVRKVE